MKATKSLPENYQLAWEVDVEKDKRQMWLLQFLGLPWAILVMAFLTWYASRVRPDVFGEQTQVLSLGVVLALLPVLGISILLHDLIEKSKMQRS